MTSEMDTRGGLPSPVQSLRKASATVAQLASVGVDIQIEARQDGKVGVILPLAWAQVFVARLTLEVETIKHGLKRVAAEMIREQAEIRAAKGEAARAWEATTLQIRERYHALCSGGVSEREAIRRIKADSGGDLTATLIRGVIAGADPRKKRAVQERDEKILALHVQGVTPKRIAAQLKLRYEVVVDVVKRKRADRDKLAAARKERQARDERILALRANRMSYRQIAKQEGIPLRTVVSIVRRRGGCDGEVSGVSY